MMKKILFEDACILKVAQAARFLVHIFPLKVSLGAASWIGDLVYFLSSRRRIAYKNLRAAFSTEKSRGQMKAIARQSFRNLAMSAVELLRFPDLDQKYIREHLEFHGLEKFKPFLEEGRGVIFLTAHFGNWELLNVTSGIIGYSMSAVARAQKHPRSDEFLNALRTSKGSEVIRKGMPLREILRSLKKGGIVGILSDQDGGKNGTFVKFFGRSSSTPSGVATFALRTGAPIFPVFIFRQGMDKHRVEVEGPLRVPDASMEASMAERMILQEFASILESKIRRDPSQWLWAHRRWKSTPNRSVVVLSDAKAGHLRQSLAVLEALRAQRKLEVGDECLSSKIIEIKFKSSFFKNLEAVVSFIFQGHFPWKHRFYEMVLEKSSFDSIMKTYADVVISCGRSLLGVHLFSKEENQAKSVVVMKPPFGLRRFEAVLVPRHDKVSSGPNIFTTQGALSLWNVETLKTQGAQLSEKLRLEQSHRKIGLLVGGETARLAFSESDFGNTLDKILRYCRERDALILTTSSRRTPVWIENMLQKKFSQDKICPLLVIANQSNPHGTLEGILGLADVLMVSGESISMVSEAVACGKPVVVFTPFDLSGLKPKYRDFLDGLSSAGRIFLTNFENAEQSLEKAFSSLGQGLENRGGGDREILSQVARKVLG